MTYARDIKPLAYDLTMEYIKQNNLLKCNNQDELPEKIKTIMKISSIIAENLAQYSPSDIKIL